MSYLKPASTKATVKNMLSQVEKKQYILTGIYAICGGVLTVMSAFAMQLIVNALTLHSDNLSYILYIIAGYCIASIILHIITIQIENRTYRYYNFIRMNMLKRVIKKLITMDYAYYEDSKFMAETDNAFTPLETNNLGLEGIYHRSFMVSKKLVGAVFLCILVGYLNPMIILIVLVYLSINLTVLKQISKYRYDRRNQQNEISRRISTYSSETSDFAYGKDIRLFHMGDKLTKAYTDEVKGLDRILKEISIFEMKVSVLDIIFLIACNFTTYYILGKSLYNGMSIANFVMYLTAINLFILLMSDISKDIGFIRQHFTFVKDLFGFFELNLITEDAEKSFHSDGPIEVEFKNVSFQYPNSDKYVYKDLNVTFDAGKKVALVGINGAGKTTLVKLLTGLYRPTSGQILINGVDYTTFASKDLQNLFGVVFQDVHPLALTIKENISASKQEIHEELVIDSLKQVGLWEKIRQTEKGLDTMLLKIIDESGIVLSGGENQKLMIARALYRKQAKMMIMDEPTAALDALAEEKIYSEFGTIMGGKTGLFISHRLASTRFCDYIVLLDGGSVAEIGTHDELLQNDGIYANMFKTQGKYYQEEA